MEDRCRELENDNRQLLERWLRRTNEEADKMNQANEYVNYGDQELRQ